MPQGPELQQNLEKLQAYSLQQFLGESRVETFAELDHQLWSNLHLLQQKSSSEKTIRTNIIMEQKDFYLRRFFKNQLEISNVTRKALKTIPPVYTTAPEVLQH